MKRLRQKRFWLIAGNALFWLGLGYFLLSTKTRLIGGSSILAILFGGWALWYSLKRRRLGGDNPELIRLLGLCFGAIALVGGMAGLLWLMQGGVPTPDQIARERINQARQLNSSYLSLAQLDLTQIPPETWELAGLTTLYADGNQLTTLPPEIGRLTNLESLDLHNNHLTALPREIGQLSHLTTLDLNQNQLHTLPAEIGQLVALKSLQAGWNQLAELPADLGKLTQLESLSLQYNHVTALPAELEQLSNLKALYLFNNNLTALPPQLGQLHNLQNLILDYNHLSDLPVELAQLTQLQTLSLNGNQLGELPSFLQSLMSSGLNVENAPRPHPGSLLSSEYFFPLIFGLAAVLAFVFNQWWGKREAALIKDLAEGRAFRIPAFARGACILVIFLIIPLDALIYLASLNPEVTRVSAESGLAIPLLLSPLLLFSLYMLAHNSGVVILTADEISVRHLWHEKRLALHEVTSLNHWRLGLPPSLILTGPTGTVNIPRSVEYWPEIYQTLSRTVSPSLQWPPDRFPSDLRITSGVIRRGLLETGSVFALYLVIGLAGFWIPQLAGQIPQVSTAWILFALTSLLFVPALAVMVIASIKPRQPSGLKWTADVIYFQYPLGKWQAWNTNELLAIDLKLSPMSVSVTNLPIQLRSSVNTYRLVLSFTHQRQLQIDQDRARQFGIMLEELHATLNHLYMIHREEAV